MVLTQWPSLGSITEKADRDKYTKDSACTRLWML